MATQPLFRRTLLGTFSAASARTCHLSAIDKAAEERFAEIAGALERRVDRLEASRPAPTARPAERPNPAYEPPEDTRSFLERNPRLVEGSLALVALALGVGGFFALRRRA